MKRHPKIDSKINTKKDKNSSSLPALLHNHRKNAPDFFKDASISSITAGFVAVLIGFASSVAIVFQAANAFGATPAELTSWVWALGIGMGLCCLLPSLWLRQPVMVAWSTPGAAVLATAGAAGHFNMQEAIGAFVLSAILVILVGITGWFEKMLHRIPMALASALLAGVLARFGLNAVVSAQTDVALVGVMGLAYLLTQSWAPRYAIILTLLVGVSWAALHGHFNTTDWTFGLAQPVWVTPTWSVASCIGLALPFFVVTMASQNLSGVAAIRSAGYDMPVSKLIGMTGFATLVLAPFGAFGITLSAITAAICMGPQAHPDPKKRYTASASCGVFYIILGMFGSVVTATLTALPKELVASIAGLALLGTIGNALLVAMKDDAHREAALVTFLVTLSGVVLAGLGSAFWGVVVGLLVLWWQRPNTPSHS